MKTFDSVTLHLVGQIYKVSFNFKHKPVLFSKTILLSLQNQTIEFDDITGELEIKANIDFMQFPENLFFSASPSIATVLRLVGRNVKSIQVSSFIVKNYDNQSGVVFDITDTETFTVGKVKFGGIENLVQANSCRSDYGEVPCDQVFHYKDEGPDSSMVIMMALIMTITGEIHFLINTVK